MTPKQLDALFEQVQRLLTERDRARDHAVRLQDEIETLKSRWQRKKASKRNGLKAWLDALRAIWRKVKNDT